MTIINTSGFIDYQYKSRFVHELQDNATEGTTLKAGNYYFKYLLRMTNRLILCNKITNASELIDYRIFITYN